MPKNGEHFIFPIACGTVKLSGRDQVFRRSISIQDHLARETNSTRSFQPLDTLTDDAEARNDFWTNAGNYIYRHLSDCDGPDLQKCDDAHALAGRREAQSPPAMTRMLWSRTTAGMLPWCRANVTVRPYPWL